MVSRTASEIDGEFLRRERSWLPAPWWVVAIIVVFAAIEPVTHAWVAFLPPADMKPTGLHIHDSVYFRCAMAMFETDYFSPYADPASPLGQHGKAWFPMADHYLYASLGLVSQWVGASEFLALGMANGIGVMLMLCAAYVLFRTISSNGDRSTGARRANLTFLIYTLGGGLGGVLFLVTGLAGLHGHSNFDEYFLRFAQYELIEHGYTRPYLLAPRLYYTLSLACCLTALALSLRFLRHPQRGWLLLAAGLFCLGTLVNLRIGPLVWSGLCLRAFFGAGEPPRRRVEATLVAGAAVALGVAIASMLLRRNPALTSSYGGMMQFSLWLSPFLAAYFFHAATWPSAVRRLARGAAFAGFALAGYLVAFCVLYALHLVYYGQWLRLYDGTIARHISDWALLGILPGLLLGWRRARTPVPHGRHDWVVLWFVLLLAVAVSAWGQGWFLRFAPARLAAVIGVPLAMVTALELDRWRRPIAFPLIATMLACGILSAAVACLCFQGPLGASRENRPFAYLHHEFMHHDDARLLSELRPGDRLLAPPTGAPQFGDVAALQRGVSTAYGVGMLVFSDIDLMARREAALRFYAPETGNEERRSLIEGWEVTVVLCPEQPPVDPRILTQLREAPWLEETATAAHGALFRVRGGLKY